MPGYRPTCASPSQGRNGKVSVKRGPVGPDCSPGPGPTASQRQLVFCCYFDVGRADEFFSFPGAYGQVWGGHWLGKSTCHEDRFATRKPKPSDRYSNVRRGRMGGPTSPTGRTRAPCRASSFTGIGGFSSALLGYYDVDQQNTSDIPVEEQVEVLSLTGDITLDGEHRLVHAHVVCGRRDGSAVGGQPTGHFGPYRPVPARRRPAITLL